MNQEITEFEFHISPVRSLSRPQTGVGTRGVLLAVEETGADLIALGWARALAGGRGPIVRALLERGRVPVLLIPVQHVGRAATGRALTSAGRS